MTSRRAKRRRRSCAEGARVGCDARYRSCFNGCCRRTCLGKNAFNGTGTDGGGMLGAQEDRAARDTR